MSLLFQSIVWAQKYEKIAPQSLEVEDDLGEIYLDPEYYTGSLNESAPPILNALEGLVFVNSLDQIVKQGRDDKDIVIEDVPMLQNQDFKNRIIPFLGQPVNLDLLNEITREVVLHYRDNKRPVVDALVPEQDIQTGTIQVLVLDSRVGKLKVEGNRYFSKDILLGKLRIKEGGEIDSQILTQDLNWINENPFRQVDLVYSRGENAQETDITLNIRDKLPLRVYSGYENSGNDSTGLDRFLAGFNWANAFGWDHIMSYQFTASDDFNTVTAHSLSYDIPLNRNATIKLLGSYAASHVNVGETGLDGINWQAGIRFIQKLPSWQELMHSVSAGFDFKESKTEISFSGLQLSENMTHVNNFILGYNISLDDDWGRSAIDTQVFYSPGNLSHKNTDVQFGGPTSSGEFNDLSLDPDSEANYYYTKIKFNRQTKLPKEFLWLKQAEYTVGTTNLLPSEQMTLGGKNTIRGYSESEINADSGYFFRTELYTPSFSLANFFNVNWNDQFRSLFFFDYAYGKNKFETVGATNNWEIYSSGMGFRYLINPYFSMQLDWGFPLKESLSYPDQNDRAHFGMSLTY